MQTFSPACQWRSDRVRGVRAALGGTC